MFARLGDNWYLNLDHVREVVFLLGGDIRLIGETVDFDDKTRIMEYFISGDCADGLRTALEMQSPAKTNPVLP